MNLPVTKFNMRANSVQREPELQRQWAQQRTYEQLRDGNPGVSLLGLLGTHDGLKDGADQAQAVYGQSCCKRVQFDSNCISRR